jgi:hypothetical protein
MKFEGITAKGVTGSTGNANNEKRTDRVKRMTAFWSNPLNAVLIPVGRILGGTVGGKTLAQWMADGEVIELDHVVSEGIKLELPKGFSMHLRNVHSTWGCPACLSAHGSAVAPSRQVDADGLAGNKFYYRPADKALFSISDTCWKQYCTALGVDVAKVFVGAAQYTINQAKADQKAEQTKVMAKK